MSLRQAREALGQAREVFVAEVEPAVPPDDGLRRLLDASVSLAAASEALASAFEAAEARVGQDYAEKLGKIASNAALAGTREGLVAMIRSMERKRRAVASALFVLVGLAGVAVGWLLTSSR